MIVKRNGEKFESESGNGLAKISLSTDALSLLFSNDKPKANVFKGEEIVLTASGEIQRNRVEQGYSGRVYKYIKKPLKQRMVG
ncbi:MAG TPA: hypothetical protein VNP04_22920 [Alphaproteobacteria bacterium]|nr:hypothetical protein [Alphaproteobacteria bacterium]